MEAITHSQEDQAPCESKKVIIFLYDINDPRIKVSPEKHQ